MDDVLADLDGLIARLEETLAPLDDAALDRVPADGGWSARQALAHVERTVTLYAERLEPLAAADAAGGDARGAHRPGWFARFLLGSLRKPGKRFKAPRVFRPRAEATPEVTPASVIAAHRRLRDLAARIGERGLGARRIGSPVLALLRLPAREAVEIQVVHGARHLEQALRAARSAGD